MTEEKKAVVANKEKPAREASTTRKRKVRVSRDVLVNKGPLVVPNSVKKPGMVYFWMLDEPYKFDKYRDLGYEFVEDARGNKVSVGRQGETMFLLEIPEDIHNEWKALKHELRMEKTAERKDIQNPRSQGQTEGIFEERLVVK